MTTTKPAWKQFEDEQLRKVKIEQCEKAITSITDYLEREVIPYYKPGTNSAFFNIPLTRLTSRKEIIKLLEMTENKLGLQIYNNEIQIYQLHSKIPK